MRKLLMAASFILIAGIGAQAQNKNGYISIDNMVLLMPETAKIDSLLQVFDRDSLQSVFNYNITEYQRKDSIWRDSLRTSATVRKKLEPELQQLIYEIQNWDAMKQQLIQNKQNLLLEPIYKKVYDAVQAVAKEKGYTWVFSQDALLVAPPGDNLLPMVAEKLKVKLPPQAANQAGARPGTN